MGANLEKMGQQLRAYRERKKITSAELARLCGVTASFLSYLENGKRRPDFNILSAIADHLELMDPERKELFAATGYCSPLDSPAYPVLNTIGRMLGESRLSDLEKKALAGELSEIIERWVDPRKREKEIRKVVIPAAGWQARILSKEGMRKTLQPAVEEARSSGIDLMVIVTAPSRPNILGDQEDICYVEQEKQFGLGHAILMAKKWIEEEPFGVILPDDLILPDDTTLTFQEQFEPCLQQMKDLYERYKSPIIAVKPIDRVHEFKDYGIVTLAENGVNEQRIRLVEDLEEKPEEIDEDSCRDKMIIIGRYLLTSEIFKALEDTPQDRNGEIQLTDALRLLRKRQRIYAYRFKGRLRRIAPMRRFYESLVDFGTCPQDPESYENLKKMAEEFLHSCIGEHDEPLTVPKSS